MADIYYTASCHSIERAKQRIGYNKKNAKKQIDRAITRGKTAEEYTSWEREYLLGECGEETTAIAYNNFCYIVSDGGICVTLFPLPTWFGKKKRFDGKERIRNPKVYERNRLPFKEDYVLCDA